MADKDKVKNKARKELWDSLLEVYEKEAGKENISDCTEVNVAELENWTIEHPDTSLRALPQLAQLKPQLVCKALPTGTTQVNLNNKGKGEIIKTRSNRVKAVSVCQISKRRKFSKSPITQKPKLEKGRRKLTKKVTTRQVENNQSLKNKLENKMGGVKLPTDKNNDYSEHGCALELRFFSNVEYVPVRSDGRTFKCPLVFKVCNCSKLDMEF